MRAASLIIAAAASLIGLIFPFWLGRQPTGLNQSVLLVMMAGIAGAFIYGTGFAPKQSLVRRLVSPAVTWPLMIGGFSVLIALR